MSLVLVLCWSWFTVYCLSYNVLRCCEVVALFPTYFQVGYSFPLNQNIIFQFFCFLFPKVLHWLFNFLVPFFSFSKPSWLSRTPKLIFFWKLCLGKTMVAYANPPTKKEERRKRKAKGWERDQIKFIGLRFERWQVVGLSELCRGKAMVADTKPQQRKKEESERLRGERDRPSLLIVDLKDGKL